MVFLGARIESEKLPRSMAPSECGNTSRHLQVSLTEIGQKSGFWMSIIIRA